MSLLTIWCQYGETVNKKTQCLKRSKLIRTEASDSKTGNVTSSSATTRSRIVESEKESDREGFHSPSTNEAQRKRKKKKGASFWRGVLLMERLQSFLWSPSPGPGSGARLSIW